MNSIPQQAVTKGYWKMEYFRAQPTASSSRVVITPGRNSREVLSVTLQGPLAPEIGERQADEPQKDAHRDHRFQRERAAEAEAVCEGTSEGGEKPHQTAKQPGQAAGYCLLGAFPGSGRDAS